MRITIATLAQSWGGMESHTVHLAEALASRGHRVTIVALGRGVYENNPATSGAFAVVPLDFTAHPSTLTQRDWLRLLAPYSADLCLLAKNEWGQGGWRFNLAARRLFRRLVYVEHVPPVRTGIVPSRRGWRRLVPRTGWWRLKTDLRGWLHTAGVERVVCVSNEVRSALRDECGFPRRKLLIIHNGVDTNRFRPDAAVRDSARRAWNIPDGAIVCGAVARLDNRSKGLDRLLRAFAAARTMPPLLTLHCVIVGDGPDRGALGELAGSLGVGDTVHLAPFTARPWEAYPGLDIYLNTSRFEALSLALIEAMACECYAIGLNVGGIPEVLGTPGVGLLIPDGDEGALAQALHDAALLPEPNRRAVGRAGRVHVVASFDAGRTHARFISLIENGV
jgi:glycosyltransferase involved in cell wall biosynthesis